jgi:hypothetical protein
MNHFSVHIGQPKIATCVPVNQSLVIDSKKMQNRRVKIMHMNFVLDRKLPELIG